MKTQIGSVAFEGDTIHILNAGIVFSSVGPIEFRESMVAWDLIDEDGGIWPREPEFRVGQLVWVVTFPHRGAAVARHLESAMAAVRRAMGAV